MKKYEYTAVVWKEEKSYVSKCPELSVASCGDTFEEAVKNLKEAVELYLENANELNMLDDIKESLGATDKFTARFEVLI